MVILKINKEMTKEEYLNYSKKLIYDYEWCKERDKCLIVPEYVDVFIVDEPANPLVIKKLTTEDLDNLDRALEKLYEKPDKIYSFEELRGDLPEVEPR